MFVKLQNVKPSKLTVILCFPCSIVGGILNHFIIENVEALTMFTALIYVCIMTFALYKKPFRTTIVFSLFSFVISVFLFNISAFTTVPISYIGFKTIEISILNNVISVFLGCVQLTYAYLIFKIKRLKKGIPKFTQKATSDLGIFISIILLLVNSLFYVSGQSDFVIILLMVFAVVFGFVFLLWWRKHITSVYLEKVHKRNVELLENMLSTQTAEIELLKKDNERLAKIIHKDNKLIPAMELAVRQTLESTNSQKTNSAELLSQLERLSGERKGILQSYENTDKSLPETKVPFIDALLKYMAQKCAGEDVDFQVMVNADVSALIKDEISQSDLYTLVADLTENAIIATRYSDRKKVLLGFEFENEHYRVDVFDSGIPFEPATLAKIGRTKTTTHKESGGSGIGMMTAFELMERYNASLLIDENLTNDLYCKKVCVIFDKERKFLINSTRKKVLDLKFRRDDICFIQNR